MTRRTVAGRSRPPIMFRVLVGGTMVSAFGSYLNMVALNPDQTWSLRPSDAGAIAVSVEYATTPFTADTVAASVQRYERLLRDLLADPRTTLPLADGQSR